jgi:hypothetical protein
MARPVDQNERKSIRRLHTPDKRHFDALGSKRSFNGRGAGVGAQGSEISGAVTKARARYEGGGNLASGKLRQLFSPGMRISERMFRHGRDQVEAVLAEADDVKRT